MVWPVVVARAFYTWEYSQVSTDGLGGDPALADGIPNQVRRVVDIQFLHEAPAMKLGRFHADMQGFRDLLGGFAFADELQDLALAGC